MKPGDRLGRYRIVEEIGTGGLARVFRAVDDEERVVALKVLDPAGAEGDHAQRFDTEFRTVADLDHPNVVRVYEAGTTGGRPWIALEYIDGDDLETLIEGWIARPDPARFPVAERIFRGLCLALSHVHDRGLVHRDLKPANVLLTSEGEPKLSDFGVVKDLENSHVTQAGQLIGTIAYMAPEQISDDPIDGRTDLYALGALLYTMLCLRRPVEADSVAGYLTRHLSEIPTPPHELDPTVPRRLERICMRLLEKSPSRRYPSAQAVLRALAGGGSDALQRLYGREALLLRMTRQLEAGTGGLVIVSGPPGSGRTTLLAAFERLALEAGRSVQHIPGTLEPGSLPPTTSVLLLDDVDSASRSAVDLACRLARQGVQGDGSLVVVAESEEHPITHGWRWAAGIASWDLGPLGPRDLVALLRDAGVPTAPSTGLASRLANSQAAQPGTMRSLVNHLVSQGWLVPDGDGLRATRTVAAFREEDLPVPAELEQRLLRRFDQLDADERELIELLAVIGRPVSASLIGRCATRPARVPLVLDRLLDLGLVVTVEDADDITLRFAHPLVASVIRHHLTDSKRQQRHESIARTLQRQRRRSAASAEAAYHLASAGLVQEALPMLLKSARAEARKGAYPRVLELLDRAAQLESVASTQLDARAADKHRRESMALRGSALLAMGRWTDAQGPLEEALALARISENETDIGRSLCDLGRVLYRLGRYRRASSLLNQALDHQGLGDVRRGRALRAIGDIHLHQGNLDLAEQHFVRALEEAQRGRNRDAEARARRGLANIRGLKGELGQAAEQLDIADELLEPDGDNRVRAGILARSIELELAAGRLGYALHRADVLVDLVHTHQLSRRLPDGLAMAAQVRFAVGHEAEALAEARRALLFAGTQSQPSWDGMLRAVRVLLAGNALEGDPLASIDEARLPDSALHDPRGQATAVRARVLARHDKSEARALARRALSRPPAHWLLSHLQLTLDASLALIATGDEPEALMALDGLEGLLDERRSAGIRLDLLLAREAAGDHSRREEGRQLVRAIASSLSGRNRASWMARLDVMALLGTT